MHRRLQGTACLALVAALSLGACSSGSKKGPAVAGPDGTTKGNGSSGGGKTPALAGAPGVTRDFDAGDGNRYTIVLKADATPAGPSQPCAQPARSGRVTVGINLTIKNLKPVSVPQPKIHLEIQGGNPGAGTPPVVAIQTPNCIDFTLAADQIPPGSQRDYQGAASNLGAGATLHVRVQGAAPANDISLDVPLTS